jgi:DNA repair protein RadC
VTYQVEDCNLVELLAVIIGGSRQLEIAQDLLAHLGSARDIARATCEEITRVDRIGHSVAVRIKAALELSRMLSSPSADRPLAIRTPEDVAALMMVRMQKLEQEHIYVLILNTRNHVIGEPVEVYRGSLNSSLIRIGELLRPAVRANAASFILVHNHPSGAPRSIFV